MSTLEDKMRAGQVCFELEQIFRFTEESLLIVKNVGSFMPGNNAVPDFMSLGKPRAPCGLREVDKSCFLTEHVGSEQFHKSRWLVRDQLFG